VEEGLDLKHSEVPRKGPQIQDLEEETPAETPSASSGQLVRSPLSTFEWLVIGFLLTSGSLHLYYGWHFHGLNERMSLEELSLGAVSILFSGQVLMRTPLSRLSLSLLFLVQIFALTHHYAVASPGSWLEASSFFRLQRLVELAFFAIAMVLIHYCPRRRFILKT